MRHRFSALSISVFMGALVALLLIASKPAAAQNGATPMTADGHPDFNGYWAGGGGGGGVGGEQFQRAADGSILYDFSLEQGNDPLCEDESCQAPNQPPYNAKYMAKVKVIAATEVGGTTPLDPDKSCKPAGLPRSGVGGQIVQTPQVIAVIHGDYTDRLIYVDGRPHPSDLESSYMGDSVGHWEGNTLVVDAIGFNDDTWLGGDVGGHHMYTSIHSEKEHVIERWNRDGDTITVETTVEDPEAFTKPWVLPARKVRLAKPGDYLVTYFCDGSGIGALLKDHYIKPNPEDRDIKYHCSGHRCDAPPAKSTKTCTATNKINCQ